MVTFKTKIGWEIWVPVTILILIQVSIMIEKRLWVGITILTAVSFLIIALISSIRYVIDGNTLMIKSLTTIKNKTIDISSIRRVCKTNNPIAAPAAALLGRIEVFYNGENSIIISPRDKKQFIAMLTSINKSIVVQEPL